MLLHPARRPSCHRRPGEHCDKPVWTYKLGLIFQRPSLLTVPKAFVGSTKVSLEVPVLFLALLLELSSCKDHVHYASTSAEASLTLREMSLLEVLYEAVDEDSGEDLASSGQQRYTR